MAFDAEEMRKQTEKKQQETAEKEARKKAEEAARLQSQVQKWKDNLPRRMAEAPAISQKKFFEIEKRIMQAVSQGRSNCEASEFEWKEGSHSLEELISHSSDL